VFDANNGEFHEAINSLGALMSAGLVKIDKTNQHGYNYVKMVQNYFNADNGWNIIMNTFNSIYSLPQIGGPRFMNCPRIAIDSTIIQMMFKEQPYNPFYLEGEYGSFDLKGIEVELKKEYNINQISSNNIIAVVTGTDPVLRNEFITVGAHLDHLGIVNDSIVNGADDNASGSAAILEIAEAVACSKPKRSVMFMLYTKEEGGLLGSYFFINNTPVPIENVKANINLDMVGRLDGDANDLAIIGADRINPKLEEVIYEVNNRTLNLSLDSMDINNLFERSDHYSFYLKEIPSVLFITGLHNDYHTPRDDPEKLDYDFLQKVSQLTYEVIMELANDEEGL